MAHFARGIKFEVKTFIVSIIIMIGFSNNCYSRQVIGFFDVGSPEQGLQGWGLDPDNPNSNIRIDFYANAPAGAVGSVLIGSTIANLSRPDVNSVTGYSGNHGFFWNLPVTFTTPCLLMIYAYGIDLNGEVNPNLTNSPRLMPFLVKQISNNANGYPITIKASSQWAGAIYSLKWKGKEFINSADHGRLLQSASSFYNSVNSWTAECYNPTEAGSDNNGNSTCTDSRLLAFNNLNGQLYSKTQMAFYSAPGSNNGTGSCPTPVNTVVTSNHIMEKNVKIGLPNMPYAIKYEVKFYVPQNETHLGMGQFEALTGYLNGEFNTFFQYNQNSQTLTQTNNLSDGEYNKPVVISTSDGQYAMGIYSPEIPKNQIWGQGYGQFQFPTQGTSKWNFVRRILNVQPNTTYTFNSYICIGTLENVRYTLSQLISTYPNG
jgi:hypothetical protein